MWILPWIGRVPATDHDKRRTSGCPWICLKPTPKNSNRLPFARQNAEGQNKSKAKTPEDKPHSKAKGTDQNNTKKQHTKHKSRKQRTTKKTQIPQQQPKKPTITHPPPGVQVHVDLRAPVGSKHHRDGLLPRPQLTGLQDRRGWKLDGLLRVLGFH